jgi:hypothetical protein
MKPFHALLCLYLATASCAPRTPAADQSAKPPAPKPENLAACIAKSGAHLYGASWCHLCHDQLKLFGPDAPKIPYTDCDPEGKLDLLPECKAAGLEFDGPFPTWILGDGRRVIGLRSLSYMAHQTGCPAP